MKDSLHLILEQLAAAPRVLLLYDFDGTLAELQPHPGQACVPAPVLDWLCELAVNPRIVVGIVSGRALDDLRTLFPFPGLILAANHGNEIRGRGVHFIDPIADVAAPQLDSLITQLNAKLPIGEGIWVESKSLTATVHLRGSSKLAAHHATSLVHSLVRESQRFTARPGRDAIDIVPNNDWHKGSAVDWIRQEFEFWDAALLYAGDDASDEDVFREFPHAITIRVGDGPTAARYRAESPMEIWALTGMIAASLGAVRLPLPVVGLP
ncbi:MAG: trehalose-phosphatase [Bryobacteraceae bacterium]